MSNEAGDKKLDHKEDIFQRFKSPRYISLHSKIEPATINIYRDIIKSLTCYQFFVKFCTILV